MSKKIKIFIALISLLYLITLIQDTYAKYATSANANTNFSIARWNILINNADIKNSSNFTNSIEPHLDENNNIKENVIAPTSTGYFDIVINGINTDVSYKYTINIVPGSLNTVTDLKVVKYTINDEPTEYTLESTSISNIVNYDDENKTTKYRFYIEWYDGIDESQNNSQDTQQTINGNAVFDVKVNVVQVAS